MTNYPQWQPAPPPGPPQQPSNAKWVLPTLTTGLVLLVVAAAVLITLLVNQNEQAESPNPSASGVETTAAPTPGETPPPEEDPTPLPPEPEESAAGVSVDLTVAPVSSWKLDLTDRYPDGAWAELVFADGAHADYMKQVIALINQNYLIAMDDLTGEIQWELELPHQLSPGECVAYAYWDMLLCPLLGEAENTGLVVQIDMVSGEFVNWTEYLPYVPTGISVVGDDWLISGYTMGEWDESALDGAGGTEVTLHARRGWLPQLVTDPVWSTSSYNIVALLRYSLALLLIVPVLIASFIVHRTRSQSHPFAREAWVICFS